MSRESIDRYVESIRTSMDADPALNLALSLGRAESDRDPRINTVRAYVRHLEEPQGDAALLAAADRIVRGEVPALNGTSFSNLMHNIHDVDGVSALDLSGARALDVIDRIWKLMPDPS